MNIAKYSVWPGTPNEFHITVLGKSKVYDELLKMSGSKMIGSVPMKVNQVDDVSQLGQQQIIYLSDGKSSALDDVLKNIQGKPIMIITEREGLYKKGAGFSFVLMDNNTLRFDINNAELEKRQIKVSKSLTALAHTIL
jgi:hypothetical protein